jgi:hypothetical protein
MKWFRLYHDLPHDRKLRKFSSQQKWAWVVILCLASESKQRGLILGEDEDALAEDCGFNCTQDYQYFLDKLRQQDMIEPIEGGLKITHWNERQFISDDVTARSSASKAKKRSQEGTFPKRSFDVPGNDEGTSSDPYSDPNSESKTEKKIKLKSACASSNFPFGIDELPREGDVSSLRVQVEVEKSGQERFEWPDEMVEPLIRETMPSGVNFGGLSNSEFSAMQFEEFWQYTVPQGAKRNKGEAKRQFMGIDGIDYKTFKDCYVRAIEAYQKKNPKEKPDEKFRFFKGVGRWIEDEEWIEFMPDCLKGGSLNLEIAIKQIPRSFRKEVCVIHPNGDWYVNRSLCNEAEQAQFSRGSYRDEIYRRILNIADFLEKNPGCIELKDFAREEQKSFA